MVHRCPDVTSISSQATVRTCDKYSQTDLTTSGANNAENLNFFGKDRNGHNRSSNSSSNHNHNTNTCPLPKPPKKQPRYTVDRATKAM